MSKGLKKVLEIIGGIGLILIGLVGLAMPIMPGWVFIIPGLIVLGQHFEWAKRLVDWAKAKAEGFRDREKKQ